MGRELILKLLVLSCAFPIQAFADLDMLCKRGYAEVVGESVSSSPESCDASAKIQAISYECGVPEDSIGFRTAALSENNEAAQKSCNDFCKNISSKCKGTFSAPYKCGFTIPAEKETMVGQKIIQCPKSCKGQAFHYCSIYHGSYFGVEPTLFKNAAANCRCFRKNK